jgi:hypothetical protein
MRRRWQLNDRMCWLGLAVACLVAMGSFATADEPKEQKNKTPPASDYRQESIEGWTCHVSPLLYEDQHNSLRQQTLRLLSNQLFSVNLLVASDRLDELKKVPIWVDLESPLRALQYHPSREWLEKHGHHGEMAKAIHLPNARYFVGARHTNEQPWAVLHELAHAYHDRVLGFENDEVRAVFEKAKEAGLYDSVLHVVGDERKHYALTNAKEFFAEMTECYIGTNDFYPFVRGELKRHDPETYQLLKKIWGEVGRDK